MAQQLELFVEENKINDEIPAWKRLDDVIRSWSALSGFEKDQENYQKLKEQYE